VWEAFLHFTITSRPLQPHNMTRQAFVNYAKQCDIAADPKGGVDRRRIRIEDLNVLHQTLSSRQAGRQFTFTCFKETLIPLSSKVSAVLRLVSTVGLKNFAKYCLESALPERPC
jgi:hypothetical protein